MCNILIEAFGLSDICQCHRYDTLEVTLGMLDKIAPSGDFICIQVGRCDMRLVQGHRLRVRVSLIWPLREE